MDHQIKHTNLEKLMMETIKKQYKEIIFWFDVAILEFIAILVLIVLTVIK